jgi:rare lipoprotein A
MKRRALIGLCSLVLGSCSSVPTQDRRDGPPAEPVDVSAVPDAVPRWEPPCRYGNPTSYEVEGQRYQVMASSRGYVERGVASWYGRKFHNRYTSCREPYDMYAMTAAHRSLPLPTYAQVTNLENGRRVVVRINDRGPFRDNRVIDLSYTAAYKLGILGRGTGRVEVRAIDPLVPSGPAEEGPVLRQVHAPVQERREAAVMPAVLSTAEQSGTDSVYLQMGAFSQRTNAERLRALLESNGIVPVQIQADEQNGFHRVRVGPVRDPAAVQHLEQRLAHLGLGKARLVTE